MKRRIIFAILGVAVFLINAGMVVMAPLNQPRLDDRSFEFTVAMDGEQLQDIISVEHVGLSIEEMERERGSDNIVQADPGAGRTNSIVLKGYLTPDRSIQNWVIDTYNGKDVRKDITVEIMDRQGDVTRTIYMFDCFPTHYELQDLDTEEKSEPVKWTLEVRVNRIEMA